MCRFCKGLFEEDRKLLWGVRSTMGDDNVCEFVNGDTYNPKDECIMDFELGGARGKDMCARLTLFYKQVIRRHDGVTVSIRPFSEPIQVNYCPFCGDQVSSSVKDPNDYSDYLIDLS